MIGIGYNVYELILEQHVEEVIVLQPDQRQNGFRKVEIHDHIFTTKQIIERANVTSGNIYAEFIDIEKVFDRGEMCRTRIMGESQEKASCRTTEYSIYN